MAQSWPDKLLWFLAGILLKIHVYTNDAFTTVHQVTRSLQSRHGDEWSALWIGSLQTANARKLYSLYGFYLYDPF